jgi:hypothetical protein
MEGREKPQTDKYEEIMDDCNYDGSICFHHFWFSHSNFESLISVAQSVLKAENMCLT